MGGILYDFSPVIAFGTAGTLLGLALISVFFIPKPVQRESHSATNVGDILGGFRYIFSNKVVLGAISLDMFAVLMGVLGGLLPALRGARLPITSALRSM